MCRINNFTMIQLIQKALSKTQTKHVLIIDNTMCLYIFNRKNGCEVSRKKITDYNYIESIFYPILTPHLMLTKSYHHSGKSLKQDWKLNYEII